MSEYKTWFVKPKELEHYPRLAIACLPPEFMMHFDAYIASNKQCTRIFRFVDERYQPILRALLACAIKRRVTVGAVGELEQSGWNFGIFNFTYGETRRGQTIDQASTWLIQRQAGWLGTSLVDVATRESYWLPDTIDSELATELRGCTSYREPLRIVHNNGFITGFETPEEDNEDSDSDDYDSEPDDV